MRRIRRKTLFATLSVLIWTGVNGFAWADRRVALVVGNSAYQKVTALPNPRNDATDVAEVLRGLSFDVISVVDADQIGFNRALGEFSRKAIDADAVLFFYAGHGIQVRGQNYFLPIDADARDEISAEFEFIGMDRVRQALDKASSGAVRIMVLDACRDNPLARSIQTASRSSGPVTRGLARVDQQAVGGMVVVYATQPNQVAQDGNERNSPFTSALLAQLKEPGLEVGTLFRRVTNDVRAKTGGKQVPELSISLGQDYYLNRNETDAAAFDKIVNSVDPNDFRAFLTRFPTSSRAPMARRMAEMMEGALAQRQREQEDAQRKADAERLARQEEERKKAEAARVAALAREQAAREAEEARKKIETETLARLERERREIEEKKAAEIARKQEQEAARLAEIERKKREETARLAAAEAERAERKRLDEIALAERKKQEETARQQAAEAARLAEIERKKEAEAARQAAAEAQKAERQRQEAALAERKKQEEAVRLAKIELARQEAESRKAAEAARAAEAERELAERRKQEEDQRLARLEAERKEAERQAALRAEEDRRQKGEALRLAEIERKRQEEIARVAVFEMERAKAEEAARAAAAAQAAETERLEAERRQKQEAERLARIEQESLAAEKRLQEARAASEAEAKRVAEAEAERQAHAAAELTRQKEAKAAQEADEARNAQLALALPGGAPGPDRRVVETAALNLGGASDPTPEAFNTPELIAAAQVQLKRLGCYGGKANGRLDVTLNALDALRRKINAPENQPRTISNTTIEDLKSRGGLPCGVAATPKTVKSARLPEQDKPQSPRVSPVRPKAIIERPRVERAAPAAPRRAPVASSAPAHAAPPAARKPFIPMIGN